MTSIKDRMKLFETNNSPPMIMPKPKSETISNNTIKKLSNSNSEVKLESLKNSDATNLKLSSLAVQENPNNVIHQFSKQTNDINENEDENNFRTKQERNPDENIPVISNEEPIEKMSNTDDSHKVLCENINEINEEKTKSIDENLSNNEIFDHENDVENTEESDLSEDLTYEYFGSIYNLPGFEHFIFNTTEDETGIPALSAIEPVPSESMEDYHIEPVVDVSTDESSVVNKAEVLKRSSSKKLIEEIFNTSIWRNSHNYSDDFIFSPSAETNVEADLNVSNRSSDLNCSILSNDDSRKSVQSLSVRPTRKNLFGGIFRSKRSPKKSGEKISINDIYDSDNGSPDKYRSSRKSELDTSSIDKGPKKPLNSIFNRDWLNSLGEGIKKKASVMNELKNFFSNKGKNSKKKLKLCEKGSYEVSSPKQVN